MVVNLEYVSESSWTEVCKKIKDAVVFIDDRSAECLHWHGGLHRLTKAGAVSVKEFSSFEGGKENDKKAIFLILDPLLGPTRMILRDIISNSSFEHCILITPCSPAVLNLATTGNVPESSNELTALHKLERDILHWMKNQKYTVEIFHSYSFGFIPLNDHFFISPAFNEIFPCFDEDLGLNTQNSKISDWDIESLPLEMQVIITYLMTSINSLLSQLNVREDIYCLGPFSNMIGTLLQKNSTSHLRSKTASTMSVLLIDRTLDVCSPVSFDSDCLLDLMKSTLPPFPGQTVDVAIDMSGLFPSSKESTGDERIFPGCLHEPKGPMFNWLFYHTCPEILKDISKEICSILKIKEQTFSPSDLEKVIQEKLACNIDDIRENSAILQFSLGIIQTLRSNSLEKTKLIRSVLMVLRQALASDNNADNALNQIIDLVNSRKTKGFELEHIFFILIFFYSFIGEKYEINSDLQALLLTSLGKAIVEDKEKYIEKDQMNFNSINNIDEFCGIIFQKLNSLRGCRNHLFKYRDVSNFQDSMMPLEYNSVLNQLLQDILDPMKIGIPDLRHKPNMSLKDNLASRFSMLLSTTRTHITDSDSLLIFFVGGITGQEVKTIKKFFKHYQKPVIIGSTSLLSPIDIINKLFMFNPLKPLLL